MLMPGRSSLSLKASELLQTSIMSMASTLGCEGWRHDENDKVVTGVFQVVRAGLLFALFEFDGLPDAPAFANSSSVHSLP